MLRRQGGGFPHGRTAAERHRPVGIPSPGGCRIRRRASPSRGWESLTPTELDVVALAAAGLSNAEIGSRLFISPTTAKTHLAHIYTKLGIANRAALAAQATARGITGEGLLGR